MCKFIALSTNMRYIWRQTCTEDVQHAMDNKEILRL